MSREPVTDARSGLVFLYVPAGRFRMGSEDDEDTQPVHTVRLRGFRLSRHEVTRAQYARFMAATGHPAPPHWSNARFKPPEQPVLAVSYTDALAFCRWCGGRLPTEAEWEYAARGADGRRFPWGSELPTPDHAVFHRDVAAAPLAVGSAPRGASPFGLEDMAGSVFEWCADWYGAGYYAGSPAENPTGPAEGKQRVIRGGSWVSLPDALRATARGSAPPESHSTLIGFRVARDLAPGE
jgi:formylglycine-generating enzyme required for sulfatase activity